MYVVGPGCLWFRHWMEHVDDRRLTDRPSTLHDCCCCSCGLGLLTINRVPTVMENPGKNCSHGKSWKSLGRYEISQKVMEKSWNCLFSWLWQLSSLWLSCMLWDTIITISETMWEWESWKEANQSWKSHGILFSDFCGNPVLRKKKIWPSILCLKKSGFKWCVKKKKSSAFIYINWKK